MDPESAQGHSLQGRPSGKSSHVRWDAESGSQFRTYRAAGPYYSQLRPLAPINHVDLAAGSVSAGRAVLDGRTTPCRCEAAAEGAGDSIMS
jgi:hypothetical protein